MTEAEIATLLSDFPVIVRVVVQWGDMDAFHHVNNTVYFRWFETARIAYTSQLGLGGMRVKPNVGPILAAIACNYRRQITFPDTVHIGSRVSRIGRTSLTMEHSLVSEANNGRAADGTSTLVVFDYQAQRPVRVPDEIRSAIERMENRDLPPT